MATGGTHVNNTFDDLYEETTRQNKRFVIFGVTGAGMAALPRPEVI